MLQFVQALRPRKLFSLTSLSDDHLLPFQPLLCPIAQSKGTAPTPINVQIETPSIPLSENRIGDKRRSSHSVEPVPQADSEELANRARRRRFRLPVGTFHGSSTTSLQNSSHLEQEARWKTIFGNSTHCAFTYVKQELTQQNIPS